MYMIEIDDSKICGILEYMDKGINCFSKAMECLNTMRENTTDEDDEEDDYERYGYRKSRNSGTHRYKMGGRYSRY